ncbi:MAG: YihY/virulence factor BrkB family protein, partial [Clostridia bacterium]|nr:YihY/virulence factor BrkB family protein [Clostridia bacterium]
MKKRLSSAFDKLAGQPLDRHGIAKTAKRVIRTVNRDRVFVYAGQAAMMILISLFPFIMLLSSLAQYVLPWSEEELHEILQSLELGQQGLGFLSELADELFHPPTVSVVSITAVTALWSASRGINAVRWGIRTMYRTPYRHGFLYHTAISLLYTVAMFAMLLVLLTLVVFGQQLLELIRTHFAWLAAPLGFVLQFRTLILLLSLTLFFMLLYRVLPSQKLSFKAQLPGALFAAVGWLLFSFAFSLYIDNFAN